MAVVNQSCFLPVNETASTAFAMRRLLSSTLFLKVHVAFLGLALCLVISSVESVADVDKNADGKPGPASIAARQAEAQAERLEQHVSKESTNPGSALLMKAEAQNLRALAAVIRRVQERRAADPNPPRYDGRTTPTTLSPAQQELVEAVVKTYDSNGDGILSATEQKNIPNYIWDELRRNSIWAFPAGPQLENPGKAVPVGFESYYAATKQSSALIKQAMTRPLTARGHFDLSLSLFGTGRFAEAALTAQIGMGLAKEDVERAAFFGVLAQSRGVMGDYQEANRAALEGHRLSPLSKELAAMRVVYSIKTGNGAHIAAAEDALAGLEESGERVFLGPMVRFLWQNRKAVVTVLTALGPVVEQIKDRWPQHKTAIEAGIQTLKTMWELKEKIESATPVTR